MAASLGFTPKTSLTEKNLRWHHNTIVMISSIIPEILVLLTKSEQSGPKSAHIRPTKPTAQQNFGLFGQTIRWVGYLSNSSQEIMIGIC